MRRRDMSRISAATFIALVAPAAAQTSPPAGRVAEQFAATLSAHDIAAFAALFAPDYKQHQFSAAAPPAKPGITPKQATVAFFTARLTGLPDLTVSIEAIVAARDMAAASFVYAGTHRGPYFGIAPTGKHLRFTSCDIFRLRDGLIVEHWGMGDIAGVLAQLKS
jgi:predicted SnoaL-like aldol condensation-catalyzing enzyme